MFLRRFSQKFGLRRTRIDSRDLTGLARDAAEVIAARTTEAMSGTLGAAEAYRMVAEKQTAAAEAYFVFIKHVLRSEVSSAYVASFNIFKNAVSSNRRRLRRRTRKR